MSMLCADRECIKPIEHAVYSWLDLLILFAYMIMAEAEFLKFKPLHQWIIPGSIRCAETSDGLAGPAIAAGRGHTDSVKLLKDIRVKE